MKCSCISLCHFNECIRRYSISIERLYGYPLFYSVKCNIIFGSINILLLYYIICDIILYYLSEVPVNILYAADLVWSSDCHNIIFWENLFVEKTNHSRENFPQRVHGNVTGLQYIWLIKGGGIGLYYRID